MELSRVNGSPPQVWGKPALIEKVRGCPLVHPHRCGENRIRACGLADTGGSPPQVWGKRKTGLYRLDRARFTPTGVGKSATTHLYLHPQEVHPHRCGEIASSAMPAASVNGSPPQVWGNRSPRVMAMFRPGFTPTGVGKSFAARDGDVQAGVHPHRCGEIHEALVLAVVGTGSPPQVWGNPVRLQSGDSPARFTPTGVGKSIVRHGTRK